MLYKLHYTIDTDSVLGRGSFGTVHSATDKNGERIAAKRIDDKDEAKLAQAAEDLQRLVSLKHQNIARLHEVLHQRNSVWVFMELCEHGDLEDYLKTGKEASNALSNQKVLQLMADIAKGVEYLHGKNVVHRDIKPKNVLVGGIPAIAKLTDFE